MTDWRIQVLRQFHTANSLYLVLDEDQLLLDEKILEKLQEDNVVVVNFQDSILFRHEFEKEYRARIEKEEMCLLIRTDRQDYYVFPYELLQSGQRVRLDVATLFPKFSTAIIRKLGVEVRDALYTAHQRYQGSSSDKETLDFLAKHVFKLTYDLAYTEGDLWKLLLTIHYESRSLPQVIKEYVADFLEYKKSFPILPIRELIVSQTFFYNYLEVEWNRFISNLHQITKSPIEDADTYQDHPFTSPFMKGILDNLFLEGFLQPVEDYDAENLPAWTHFGIKTSDEHIKKDRLENLYVRLHEAIISEYQYKDWIKLAELYGQFKYLALSTGIFDEQENELSVKINQHFENWMLCHYGALISLPHLPKPKMVHHIPHFLLTQEEESIALIVMDGMGFMQWAQIRERLIKLGLSFEDNGVFAWVPTLTSVSRQAIFSGLEPLYFENSILTTNKESKLWGKFWEDHEISRSNVAYQKGLGKEQYNKENFLPLKQPNVRVYGAVIDIIDQALHGAVQGAKSVAAEIDIWLDTHYLVQLIHDLRRNGFAVYLTSDHGNKESVGIGRISEGVLVETKGERVRTYKTKELRDYAAVQNPMTLMWNDVGLPEHFHVLLAREDAAFVNRGDRIVSHGGISIDEVIVPFIKVMS